MDPRGTSQIEAITALRTRIANFSTSSTSLDNINFQRTRTIISRPRRFRRRQTTKHEDEDTRKEIVDGFLRERRGNTTRKYERFYYWWLAESYIFERNNENSIAHESDGILNGGEYVRDGRIADYIRCCSFFETNVFNSVIRMIYSARYSRKLLLYYLTRSFDVLERVRE